MLNAGEKYQAAYAAANPKSEVPDVEYLRGFWRIKIGLKTQNLRTEQLNVMTNTLTQKAQNVGKK